MTRKNGSGSVPRLRFPGFLESPAWSEATLEELSTTVTPPAKLQSSSYQAVGRFPIVDQSKELVCGWTDDSDSIITESLPLIVFGDHTCVLKLVRQPFAQGADGIKVLKAKSTVDPEFLFQALSHRPLEAEDYKRHFSTLRKRRIYFPDIVTGEQQKVAQCLAPLDDLVAAQAQKVEALKAHKRGLMQRLFPREGESAPRLRFPESCGGARWHRRRVASLLNKVARPVSVHPDLTYREIGIRSHGKGVFHKEAVSGRTIGSKRVFHVVKNALVVNIVFAWEQAVATTSDSDEGMIASHRFPMFVAKPGECDVRFVKEFLLTKRGKELLGIASPGGAGRNKTLGQKEFENLEIVVPESVEEQSRIADVLALLDGRIAEESDKLDALQTHKGGLMQQLFPSS